MGKAGHNEFFPGLGGEPRDYADFADEVAGSADDGTAFHQVRDVCDRPRRPRNSSEETSLAGRPRPRVSPAPMAA